MKSSSYNGQTSIFFAESKEVSANAGQFIQCAIELRQSGFILLRRNLAVIAVKQDDIIVRKKFRGMLRRRTSASALIAFNRFTIQVSGT
jgi:hypothetical protein